MSAIEEIDSSDDDVILDVEGIEDVDEDNSPEADLPADLSNKFIENFKSKNKYIKRFRQYLYWKNEQKIPADNNSEAVLVNYFEAKVAAGLKGNTCWSYCSMLIPFFLEMYNIDLKSYHTLRYYLKSLKRKVEAPVKKAAIFDEHHLKLFLEIDSDDPEVIRNKALFAISWFCFPRGCEIVQMQFDDLKWNSDGYLDMELVRSKTNDVTDHKLPPIIFNKYDTKLLIKRYTDLIENKTGRFFRCYRKNLKRFTNEPLGEKAVRKITTNIAKTLNLANPEKFTGHSFRRSSLSNIANKGASVPALMKAGNHKSVKTALGYVDSTGKSNRKIADLANGGKSNAHSALTVDMNEGLSRQPVININNCAAVTINNYYHNVASNPVVASTDVSSQTKCASNSPTRPRSNAVTSAPIPQNTPRLRNMNPPHPRPTTSTPTKRVAAPLTVSDVDDSTNWSLGLNVTAEAIINEHELDKQQPHYNLRKRSARETIDNRQPKRHTK